MNYIKAATLSEIPAGGMKKVLHKGQEILLASVDGTFHAIDGRCPHLGGHLCDGELVDGIITCPRHGARFDVRTGQAVGNARILFARLKVKDARTLPVKVEGEDILVGVD